MKIIREEWSNYTRLIKMLAEQFGCRCEVVLHDLTNGYEHTIVAIENGYLTDRRLGDCGSNLGLEVLARKSKNGDLYNYITKTKDGKVLRSSTSFIRDDKDEVIGAICINYDITDLMSLENALRTVTMIAPEKAVSGSSPEIFANNVGEIIDFLAMECQIILASPLDGLNKADKLKAIEFFDSKGAFMITKAGDRICEYLNISKFTLYSYLDTVRKNLVVKEE